MTHPTTEGIVYSEGGNVTIGAPIAKAEQKPTPQK